jgi:hypothetical protein
MEKLTFLERTTSDITAALLSAYFYDGVVMYLLYYFLLSKVFRSILFYIKNWTGGSFN